MPAVSGFFAPVVWTGASRAALAIPASVIATTLLPIAYFTFLLLMNSKSACALGDQRPKGGWRVISNLLMIGATAAATMASVWVFINKGTPGQWGLAGLGLLFLVGIVSFIRKRGTA
ncbi:MAG: hypothetical protein J6386_06075 [Candidatus Synoicihabitans palmerolidicus]|nr:hypothetical protein [Candidatus Synoicihabitans palmerolidicus]